ncbi:hypothetical protein D512_07438 [Burkholderia pseudomallei MSHR1043]|nr:hypothetical protein CXQ84_14395 [Burkholderia pseudomallei]EDU07887.1 hypothetical protein BURPS1655_A2399 [Burkholderia pseudomallei 1655]EMP76724.1 hypothetical protein D512_07438 [Burkholderia pseudomallei MSHR1043]
MTRRTGANAMWRRIARRGGARYRAGPPRGRLRVRRAARAPRCAGDAVRGTSLPAARVARITRSSRPSRSRCLSAPAAAPAGRLAPRTARERAAGPAAGRRRRRVTNAYA